MPETVRALVFTLSRNPATRAEEIILLDVGTHDEVYYRKIPPDPRHPTFFP